MRSRDIAQWRATIDEEEGSLALLAAYLSSDRRIPFNEDGIFRHYKALDV